MASNKKTLSLLLFLLTICATASGYKWSECSRTCGGIQRSCESDTECYKEKFRRCFKSICGRGSMDRDEQCHRYDGLRHHGAEVRWRSAVGVSNSRSCTSLHCEVAGWSARDSRHTPSIRFGDTVLDGSKCAHGKVCFDGACVDKRVMVKKVAERSKLKGGDDVTSPGTALKKVHGKMHYFTSEWSECDRHCWRTREVFCRISVESLGLVVAVDSFDCGGIKPISREICPKKYCHQSYQPGDVHWTLIGYTQCSEKCIGGTSDARYACARIGDASQGGGLLVTEEECTMAGLEKPSHSTVCNDKPCPASWHTEQFGRCTVDPCRPGLNNTKGTRQRKVKCVRVFTRSNVPEANATVAEYECDDDKPVSSQSCVIGPESRSRVTSGQREVTCVNTWYVGEWSPCREVCTSRGRLISYSTRLTYCRSVTSQGRNVTSNFCEWREDMISFRVCSAQANIVQTCNYPTAAAMSNPGKTLYTNDDKTRLFHRNSMPLSARKAIAFVQTRPQKFVLFSAEGSAQVIQGVGIRIRCRNRRVKSSKVEWRKVTRGHAGSNVTEMLVTLPKGRIRTNNNKELQIRKSQLRDAGTYQCMQNNKVMGEVYVTFLTKTEALYRYEDREDVIKRSQKFYQDLRTDQRQREEIRRSRKKGNRFDKSRHWRPLVVYADRVSRYLRKHYGRAEAARRSSGSRGVTRGHRNSAVPVRWAREEWSRCDRCDTNSTVIKIMQDHDVYTNTQHRKVTCELTMRNYYLELDQWYCYHTSGHKPATTRTCPNLICSNWQTGTWSKCHKKKCVARNKATQVRTVHCKDYLGNVVDDSACEKFDKPASIQQCTSKACVPNYVPGNWSKCTYVCGSQGTMSRKVTCRWKGQSRISDMCDTKAKPQTQVRCKLKDIKKYTYRECCSDRGSYCVRMVTNNKSVVNCNSKLKEICCRACKEKSKRRSWQQSH